MFDPDLNKNLTISIIQTTTDDMARKDREIASKDQEIAQQRGRVQHFQKEMQVSV